MAIQKFEDIIAWQKAQDLAVEVITEFEKIGNKGFKYQICNAVTSISNNIAEGFDRSSDADFTRFLYISISSASETKSMIYLAARLGYIGNGKKESLLSNINEVSRIIRGLIKSLNP